MTVAHLPFSDIFTKFADNDLGKISADDAREAIMAARGWQAFVPPTVDNDSVDTAGIGAKFGVWSRWLDRSNGDVWVLKAEAPGAAQWVNVSRAYRDDVGLCRDVVWGLFQVGGLMILENSGIDVFTRVSAGVYSLHFVPSFQNSRFAVSVSVIHPTGPWSVQTFNLSSQSVEVYIWDSTGTPNDPNAFSFLAIGTFV